MGFHLAADLGDDFGVLRGDIFGFCDVSLQIEELNLERGLVVFAQEVLADAFPMAHPHRHPVIAYVFDRLPTSTHRVGRTS